MLISSACLLIYFRTVWIIESEIISLLFYVSRRCLRFDIQLTKTLSSALKSTSLHIGGVHQFAGTGSLSANRQRKTSYVKALHLHLMMVSVSRYRCLTSQ